MRILAIDPAADGAAVMVDGEPRQACRVVAAWTWKEAERDKRAAWLLDVWGAAAEVPKFVRTPAEVGRAVALSTDAPDGLVVEGAYVGKNQLSALRIARIGGYIAGGVQAGLAVPPVAVEVQPTAWRALLGLGARNREAAKARSLAGVPSLLPSIRPFLEALGPLDHVTDAGGMALVGFLYRADLPGFQARVASALPRR